MKTELKYNLKKLTVLIILTAVYLFPLSGCNQRTPTDGFAEQNGRDAERADLTCSY